MLELEEINESWESSSEVYECKFFCKHLYICHMLQFLNEFGSKFSFNLPSY
jgi:hypothetical protein